MGRILLVDDCHDDFEFISFQIQQLDDSHKVEWAKSASQAINKLDKESFDCILSDFQMPKMDGLKLLKAIRKKANDTPFIFLTGQGNEELAAEALRSGADDYFTKEAGFAHYQRLLNSIRRLIEAHQRRSKQNEAEEALRASEAKYRSLFETSKDVVYITSFGGDIIDINPSGTELFGYSQEDLKSMKVSSLYANPEDRNAFSQEIEKSEFVKDYPVDLKRKDGSIINVLITATVQRDTRGRVIGYQGVIRDVTAHMQAEEALKESDERFRSILENASIGFYRTTSDGRILFVNPAIAEILGYSSIDDLKKINLEEGSHADYPRCYFRERLEQEGNIIGMEANWTRKDGSVICIRESARAVQDSTGNIIYYEGTLEDITDRKQAEIELKVSKDQLEKQARLLEIAYKELESFAHTVSHDLRTPLWRLNSWINALINDHSEALGSQGEQILDFLKRDCTNMQRLIADLLSFSKSTSSDLHRAEVNLSQCVRNISKILKSENPERAVEFVITPGIKGNGDPLLLNVVLENLIGNAWKFTKKERNARIEFGVTNKSPGQIYYVKDNGVGFDSKQVDKLFETFRRLHADQDFEGTGIGLATVKRIIQRHGGLIWAEGKVGKGATFYFTLD